MGSLQQLALFVTVYVIVLGVSDAGHSHQGYFQYLNVPGPHQYEFGFHRGNQHHYISRYEQSKDWKFRTKVRWGDQKGGYGEHYFDYNHIDKHKHNDDGHGHGHGHKQHHHHEPVHHHGWHGGYSEPSPAVVPVPAFDKSGPSGASGETADGLEVIYTPPPKPQRPTATAYDNRRRLVLPQEWQEPMPQPQTQMRPTRRLRPQPPPRRRFFRRYRN